MLPTLAVAGCVAALSWAQRGSIAGSDWLPALIALALLVAAVLALGGGLRPGRVPLLALGGLLASAAWAGASTAWAPAPALARDEAALRLLYAAAFAIPLLTLRDAADRLAAVSAATYALGGLAVATALKLLLANDPAGLFIEGRLYFPISYANAQAALFLAAFWPAVLVASRRAGHFAARSLALGSAVACLSCAAMTQSKGAVVGLAVSGVVFFALTPLRLRAFVPVTLSLALVAAAFGRLTDAYDADEAALEEVIRRAGATVLLVTAGAVVLGLLYTLADRRINFSPDRRRLAGGIVAAALVLAAGGAGAAFVTAHEKPAEYFSAKWDELTSEPADELSSTTHLGSLGSRRSDFWRVAADQFREHPVAGIGARGFQTAYLRHGSSYEEPARAHSLPLDVAAEEGVVGAALLLAALIPLMIVLIRRGRRASGGAALAATAVYFLAHASVDWIWTVPAVGIAFFLLLGIAAAADSRPFRNRPAALGGTAFAVLIALLATAPWLSSRLADRAAGEPERAVSDLRWARRLDPLSVQPFIVEAGLAQAPEGRIAAYRKALDKQPSSAALHFVLGLRLQEAGRSAEADAEFAAAERLAPNSRYLKRPGVPEG